MIKRIREEFDVERHRFPGLVLYEVSSDDLDHLEKETLSVGEDFSFFLACLTTAISLSASMLSFDVPIGKLYDSFFLITIVSYIGAIFFGYRWLKARRGITSIVRKIKERMGPLGETGKELSPADLQAQEPKPPEIREGVGKA
jgi:hypothetical protein